MSHSTISISSDSTGESFRSSHLLVILSDTKAEVEPSEALLYPGYVLASPIYAPASPDYYPRLDTESEPFDDESEEPIEDAPKVPTTSISSTTTKCTITSQEIVTITARYLVGYIIPEFVIPEAKATVALIRRQRIVEAHCWDFSKDGIDTWRSRRFMIISEISVTRIKSIELEIETLCARSIWAEGHVAVLQGLHGIVGVRIVDLEIRVEDVEDRLE
ncbi:hypothetical protein Tco_0963155 [Tanacetum coccineum]